MYPNSPTYTNNSYSMGKNYMLSSTHFEHFTNKLGMQIEGMQSPTNTQNTLTKHNPTSSFGETSALKFIQPYQYSSISCKDSGLSKYNTKLSLNNSIVVNTNDKYIEEKSTMKTLKCIDFNMESRSKREDLPTSSNSANKSYFTDKNYVVASTCFKHPKKNICMQVERIPNYPCSQDSSKYSYSTEKEFALAPTYLSYPKKKNFNEEIGKLLNHEEDINSSISKCVPDCNETSVTATETESYSSNDIHPKEDYGNIDFANSRNSNIDTISADESLVDSNYFSFSTKGSDISKDDSIIDSIPTSSIYIEEELTAKYTNDGNNTSNKEEYLDDITSSKTESTSCNDISVSFSTYNKAIMEETISPISNFESISEFEEALYKSTNSSKFNKNECILISINIKKENTVDDKKIDSTKSIQSSIEDTFAKNISIQKHRDYTIINYNINSKSNSRNINESVLAITNFNKITRNCHNYPIIMVHEKDVDGNSISPKHIENIFKIVSKNKGLKKDNARRLNIPNSSIIGNTDTSFETIPNYSKKLEKDITILYSIKKDVSKLGMSCDDPIIIDDDIEVTKSKHNEIILMDDRDSMVSGSVDKKVYMIKTIRKKEKINNVEILKFMKHCNQILNYIDALISRFDQKPKCEYLKRFHHLKIIYETLKYEYI